MANSTKYAISFRSGIQVASPALRKLGERFDVLVKNFGYGILGLLSWPRGDLLYSAVPNTDEL